MFFKNKIIVVMEMAKSRKQPVGELSWIAQQLGF